MDRRRLVLARTLLAVCALALALPTLRPPTLLGQDAAPSPARAAQFEALRRQVPDGGTIRVIVSLRLAVESPDASLATPEGMQRRRDAVAAAQDAVLEALADLTTVEQVRRFDLTAGMAVTIGRAALDRLETLTQVTAISADGVSEPLLNTSLPLIQADQVAQFGTTGAGIAVAILDTGVDKAHADFGGRVVSEACFSTTDGFSNLTSVCPGAAASSTATGSGEDCPSGISSCDHGTHVASIAAGVAPQARIIAIQVFSRHDDNGSDTACADVNRTSPCMLSRSSDQIAGLNRVVALSGTRTIAAVNMSLGGGQFSGPCDGSFTAMRDAVALLRALGIAVVAASGNSGFRNAMASPACLSNVISVAATNDSDLVPSISNISTLTTLFAPGSAIFAALPQVAGSPTVTRGTKNGTSMAAPHVAGALALLREELTGVATPQIVADLTARLRTTGPLITDQRTNGIINFVRRLDVRAALCTIVSCDADDFRTVTDTLVDTFGSISPSGDRDFYSYAGTAGERITVELNQRLGLLDPVLEILDPNNLRVALDDNSGDGNDAQVTGLTLQRTGRYTIIVRDAGTGTRTGTYGLDLTREALAVYPPPRITFLDPASVTATLFGSDFWVAIHGSGFTRETQARWDGATRAVFYVRPTLIYVRALAADVAFPARTALLVLRNPTPGGGVTGAFFRVTAPTLGTFTLAQPTVRHAPVGVPVPMEAQWVAPDAISWRTMQNMDMRLRGDNGEVAAWVRVVERAGAASFFRLVNAAGEVIGEGLPGSPAVLEIPGVVSLDLAASTFAGSADTATMRPVLTFGPEAVGLYNVEFAVDNEAGEVQADDVLGLFQVLPAGCVAPLQQLAVTGPTQAPQGTAVTFTASPDEAASLPVSYVWAPEPEQGQGSPTATYRWMSGGVQPVNVSATNCGGFAAASAEVTVPAVSLLAEGATGWFFDLDVLIANPHTQEVPYTLTYLTPSGAPVARNLTIPAQSRRTIRANTDPGLAGQSAVSTVVTVPSGLPLAVERTMFWDQASHYGGHGGSAVQAAAPRWYFAEGSQGFFDTWLLLANPGATPIQARVSFLRELEAPFSIDVVIPANARETIWAGAYAALVNRSFSIEVEADGPVMAERAMYWSSQGRYWNGGHDSAGVSSLSTFWFLAEGATGDYFDMYVLLGNPGTDATTAAVTFLLSDGTTVDRTYDIPARRRLTLNVEDQDPRLRNAEVSVRVSAGEPIVVERAMYWPGSSATWQDAHNSFGVTETALAWMLAEGRAGTPAKYETFVLLANPSSAQSADVRLTFLRETGTPVVRTVTVAPNSRHTVWASALAELAESNFGVVVESTNEVPIAVERAMYWDSGGQHWAAGINTTATRLR